jgi:selenide, water dikinase
VVSPATGDDAAVYRLPDGRGLVQTVDFFTPIVDDAFDWGRIAATNALSDVYAMGGSPVTALNLVAWPIEELPLELLAQVLEGGASVARQAGVTIVGGHSIHDPEPKYGMSVAGFVDMDRLVRNSAMRAGDRLFLTKPLGLGIISTAIKRGRASPEQIRMAVQTMTTLNRAGSEAMVAAGAVAGTDVTGFGLLGHLHTALVGSGAAAVIDAAAPRFLPGVLALAEDDVVPSGTKANRAYVSGFVEWGELTRAEQLALADAQTSGGLLVAIAPARVGDLRARFEEHGVDADEIGEVVPGEPGHIRLTGRVSA